MMISPLARPASPAPKTRRRRNDGRIVPLDARPPGLIGLCVHTTGSTIVAEAHKEGVPPLEHAVSYYLRPDSYFPNYVCGWRGWRSAELVAICAEDRIALHVGLDAGTITAYNSGEWLRLIDASRWLAAWPGMRSPLHLYRGSSPNRGYIGLELLPLLQPRENGLRYTDEQHETVAELAADIFARHGLTPERRRVAGHEDLSPLGSGGQRRWNGGGGWDPGARRAVPWFDWTIVYRRLGLDAPPTFPNA